MPVYCFLELSCGFAALPGKVIIELFDKQVPKVCENFRALCTGEKGGELHYEGTQFHRIIETFTCQAGDTSGTKIGGSNIYGNEPSAFQGEDLYWRDVDEEMLLCMAESYPRSQFFITLRPSPHLNGQHCCFGKVIRGQQILQQISEVEVNDDDEPVEPVKISRCGELEYKGPPVQTSASKAILTEEPNAKLPVPSDVSDIRDQEKQSVVEDQEALRSDRRRSHSPSRRNNRLSRHEERTRRASSREANTRSRPADRSPEQRRHRSSERHRRPPDRPRYREDRERIERQDRSREYPRDKRGPEVTPEVVYKGRGKMVYQQRQENVRYRNEGRLS